MSTKRIGFVMRFVAHAGLIIGLSVLVLVLPREAVSQTILVGQTESMIFLPSYVAKGRNYFKDEGLDVDLHFFRGGAQALAAVISKDAQIYVGVPSTAMKAFAKGQKVRMFGVVMQQNTTSIILTAEAAKRQGLGQSSSLADRIKSLKGLTVGVNAGGGGPEELLRFVLHNERLSPEKDVTISPVGAQAAVLAAFARNRIDALVQSPPITDMAVSQFGGYSLINFGKDEYEPLRGMIRTTLIARADWLDENPDRAARLVRAFWKAERLIRDKPEEALEAIKPWFGSLPPKDLRSGFMANREAVPTTPRIDRKGLEINKKFAEIIDGEALKLNLDDVFTNRFVDLAAKGMQ